MSESLDALRDYLSGLPNGAIGEPEQVELLLARCWDELAPPQGGMTASKLYDRTEKMEWNSPILTFPIERHGARQFGSKWAELQGWRIDINKGSASCTPNAGKRLKEKSEPRLNVNPMADEVATLVFAGTKDERLKWYGDFKVRVLIGEFIPEGLAVAQTLRGRRKRFIKAVEDRLKQQGWHKVGVHTFEKHRESNPHEAGPAEHP
jgi:hypothetical protein